jgi:hypothetical protein
MTYLPSLPKDAVRHQPHRALPEVGVVSPAMSMGPL